MSMERNYDWKGPVALVLAGLALFIALGGRDVFNFSPMPQNAVAFVDEGRLLPVEAMPAPEMPQIFPVHPREVPAVPHVPESHFFDTDEFRDMTYGEHGWPFWVEWRRWFGQMPSIMPLLLALALVFFGWRLLTPNRNQPAMPQAPAPPHAGPGPAAPPPPGPPYYGDIDQRQADS